jgi:hypothetical protein
MKYVLKVWLQGGLGEDHLQPLSKVSLCLHSCCNGNEVKADQVSNAIQFDHTDWEKSLVAEGMTNILGKTELQCNDRYTGGAFDVGIYLRSTAQKNNLYLHLATLTPSWHKDENEFVSSWNYCLLPRSESQPGIFPTAEYQRGPSVISAGKRMCTSVPT